MHHVFVKLFSFTGRAENRSGRRAKHVQVRHQVKRGNILSVECSSMNCKKSLAKSKECKLCSIFEIPYNSTSQNSGDECGHSYKTTGLEFHLWEGKVIFILQRALLIWFFSLTPMCIKHCMLSALPSSVKKNPQAITRVGFVPTTFALLEQMSSH